MDDIQKAITIVKNGGIIVYPTDTVFGIACRIDDKQALRRLFDIKNRSENQSVPVLVDSIAMAQEYLRPIPQDVQKQLMDVYWPGGLTIVLPCITAKMPTLVRGGGETLGVRIPNHPITHALIQGIDNPITGTSANFHGHPAPTKREDIDPDLITLVDFVLPGECYDGTSSTVIDCSVTPWKILREGAVKLHLAKYPIYSY